MTTNHISTNPPARTRAVRTPPRAAKGHEEPQPRPSIMDPAKLPDEYGMKALGTCLAPEILDGTTLAFSKVEPIKPGDFAIIWKRLELVKPGQLQAVIKRIIMPPPSWLTFPWQEHPDSEARYVIVAEQLNPPRRVVIECRHILALHRCLWPQPESVRFYPVSAAEQRRVS